MTHPQLVPLPDLMATVNVLDVPRQVRLRFVQFRFFGFSGLQTLQGLDCSSRPRCAEGGCCHQVGMMAALEGQVSDSSLASALVLVRCAAWCARGLISQRLVRFGEGAPVRGCQLWSHLAGSLTIWQAMDEVSPADCHEACRTLGGGWATMLPALERETPQVRRTGHTYKCCAAAGPPVGDAGAQPGGAGVWRGGVPAEAGGPGRPPAVHRGGQRGSPPEAVQPRAPAGQVRLTPSPGSACWCYSSWAGTQPDNRGAAEEGRFPVLNAHAECAIAHMCLAS